MELLSIFKGTTGLNTKLDPVRLGFNSETGIVDLAGCVDCVIDDTGRLCRRNGVTATVRTEAWKNLFSCNSFGVGTTGDALCIIEADMSYTAIRNITQDARMSYVRDTDGAKDVIYYCNGHEKGRIIDKVSNSWPLIAPVGAASIKELSQAPIGHLLEVRNGRMFIAKDNYLYYSEPNTYHAYRMAANFIGFQSRLRMIQAVTGGLWVSDSEAVYFLAGDIMPTRLEMLKQMKMSDYPAIEGTAVKVSGSKIGKGIPGIVVIFTTPEGICIGTEDGQFNNVTERKLVMPSGLTGTGVYKDGHYTVTID